MGAQQGSDCLRSLLLEILVAPTLSKKNVQCPVLHKYKHRGWSAQESWSEGGWLKRVDRQRRRAVTGRENSGKGARDGGSATVNWSGSSPSLSLGACQVDYRTGESGKHPPGLTKTTIRCVLAGKPPPDSALRGLVDCIPALLCLDRHGKSRQIYL